MASFRRTMSVVQRDGAAHNGEAFTISSVSPKSSYAQNYPPSSRFFATSFGSMYFLMLLYRIRALVLGICSQRSSRPLERSKSKGTVWKRAFFHFFVFFIVGIFIGFTPFVLVNFSSSLISKNHTFSFEVNHPTGNVDQYVDMARNRVHSFEKIKFKDNVSLGKEAIQKPADDIADAPSASSSFQDVDFVYQKLLIIVTPTYARPFQAYYMNRLAQTLRLVPPPLLWIVVEMSAQSAETAEILRKTGVMYRYLVCENNITSIKNRGVHQRNAALSHIEKHRLDGIVYFADEDNIYSLDLFKHMREIRRFGTWPVAMLIESKNKATLEGPVCNSSQVIGWHTNERNQRTRRFYVDMSGFAFNSTILWDPRRWRRPTLDPIRQLDTVKEGFQETTFIEQVVEDESQMEGLPKDCSRIMVWHLHLETSKISYPRGWLIPKNLDVVIPLM